MSEAIFAALCVAFAAFAVWLTVRIINRRERWAKRAAVGLVVLAMYPLGVGPFYWFQTNRRNIMFRLTILRFFREPPTYVAIPDIPSRSKQPTTG